MANAARKRRKRRRAGRPPGSSANPPAPSPRRTRQAAPATGATDDRPPAPWGSFPLNELIIFLALCMLVASFIVDGTRAGALFAVALILGSMATVEFAVREHFSGYRSHSALLAAVPAVITLGLLYWEGPTSLSIAVRLAIGAVIFGLCFWALTAAFRSRTGRTFKLR
jgi:hypothetical protein